MAMEGTFQTIAESAAAQHGVVSGDDLRAAAVEPWRVERFVEIGALERCAPGVVRVSGSPETWRQRLMVATLSAGPGCVVSHWAAAALHGFDRFPPGPVEVLVDRPYRSRDPWVTIHSTRSLEPVDIMVVDSIPVTTPERTLIDLAARVGRRRLEEAIDSGVRDRTVDLAVLRTRMGALRRRGRVGIRKLESLLGDSPSARPTTVLERAFLRHVERAGLARPECQVPVSRPDGSLAYVDFVFPGTGVAVEVDGHRAHTTRRQRRHDNERANDLVAADLRILRFTYEQVVDHPEAVIADCRRALGRAA